jgi:hypothetical protein
MTITSYPFLEDVQDELKKARGSTSLVDLRFIFRIPT